MVRIDGLGRIEEEDAKRKKEKEQVERKMSRLTLLMEYVVVDERALPVGAAEDSIILAFGGRANTSTTTTSWTFGSREVRRKKQMFFLWVENAGDSDNNMKVQSVERIWKDC